MSYAAWSGELSRRITERIVVEGDLVLETPAHFGNGDASDLTDMPLLTDPFDNKTPLLTGASIAGALRNYLREREHGYARKLEPLSKEGKESHSVLLFGGLKSDDDGMQSPLIVDDALGRESALGFRIEARDGVRIDPRSRTAQEKKLFNAQLWQAGTTFRLRFELAIRKGADSNKLKLALATALSGFNDGGITLGGRKRRGYGRVHAECWHARSYDLTKLDGLTDWIGEGGEALDKMYAIEDLVAGLGLQTDAEIKDRRRSFHLNATFSLDGSLLIRAGTGKDDQGPDMTHLHTHVWQAGGSVKREPVLSGTSLAGALRARAMKIARTLGSQRAATDLVDCIFGRDMAKNAQPTASRLTVREETVQNVEADLVQNRVSIDRFTGGTRDGALFNQQPVFGGDDSTVTIDLRLANPKDHEMGLLLLLLKDLWTGDLSLGGESSVGRGRLKGKQAKLAYEKTWTIDAVPNSQKLAISGEQKKLESFVSALNTHLQGGSA